MATGTIVDALDHPQIFAPLFRGPSWAAWRTLLCALFGLQMSPEQLELYRQCTGRTEPPSAPFQSATLVVGRRDGKSRVLALIAVYLACFRDYTPYLAAGESGIIGIVATDRQQAKVLLRYIVGTLRAVPALAAMIEETLAESIRLTNGILIKIHTGSIGAPRGRTFIAVLCDEIAFWRSDDSANPDVEVVAAVRPGLATIPGSLLMLASSPYAKTRRTLEHISAAFWPRGLADVGLESRYGHHEPRARSGCHRGGAGRRPGQCAGGIRCRVPR